MTKIEGTINELESTIRGIESPADHVQRLTERKTGG